MAQVVNHVVFAERGNTEARELQAAALEQLGYQAESGPWRNFYLTGAQELRSGAPTGADMNDPSPLLRARTIEMIFDVLGYGSTVPAPTASHSRSAGGSRTSARSGPCGWSTRR